MKMMAAKKLNKEELMALKLIHDIRFYICVPCDDQRKNRYNVNLRNPLECTCFCDRVDSPLSSLRRIIED